MYTIGTLWGNDCGRAQGSAGKKKQKLPQRDKTTTSSTDEPVKPSLQLSTQTLKIAVTVGLWGVTASPAAVAFVVVVPSDVVPPVEVSERKKAMTCMDCATVALTPAIGAASQ